MNVLHWFSDPFRSEFMQRALLATVIIGVVSPVVGVWVVLRRMANLGDAMGHGTLAGVAIAYSAGINVVVGALGAGLLMALLLDRKSTRLNSSHIPLSRMPSSA